MPNPMPGKRYERGTVELWFPTKKVYTINEATGRKSSRTVKYKDGEAGPLVARGTVSTRRCRLVHARVIPMFSD